MSGDVHCAAVGVLKTLTKKKMQSVPPAQDPKYMLNVVTSAYYPFVSFRPLRKRGVEADLVWCVSLMCRCYRQYTVSCNAFDLDVGLGCSGSILLLLFCRPPAGVLALVGQLSTKTHRTMHHCDTDETMVPYSSSLLSAPISSHIVVILLRTDEYPFSITCLCLFYLPAHLIPLLSSYC